MVVFGPNESDDITLDEFKSYYIQPTFVIFALVLTGVAIWTYWGVKYYEMLNTEAGFKNDVKFGRNFLMISYVSLAAYWGSWSILFMKSGVLMLYNMNVTIATDWFFWFIVLGCFVVNFLLEYFRQRALACFGAMLIVPVYQVLYIVGAALFGAMYFHEFSSLSFTDLIMFIFAIFLTMVGVVVIAFDVATILDEFMMKLKRETLDYIMQFDKKLTPESQLLFG